jgi:hypothetical protein
MYYNGMVNLIESGQNIKAAREKYLPCVSLNRAAAMALLSYTQLKNIEEGRYNARIAAILQITEKWNIPLSELLGDSSSSGANNQEGKIEEISRATKAAIRRSRPSGAQGKSSCLPGSPHFSAIDKTKVNP